jgi:hypothetical protein
MNTLKFHFAVVTLLYACGKPAETSMRENLRIFPVATVAGGTHVAIGRPIQWAVPTCPLRYEVATFESMETEGEASKFDRGGIHSFYAVDATALGAGMNLKAALTPELRIGKWRGPSMADTSMAAVHLETDGAHWREVDGETMAFKAMGTQGGLAWLFPALPNSETLGSKTTWSLILSDRKAVCLTEAARGSHTNLTKELCEAKPSAQTELIMHTEESPFAALVTLVRFQEEKGVKAAVFSMIGSAHASIHTDMSAWHDAGAGASVSDTDMTAEYTGEYVILESGRLLRASLEKVGLATMGSTGSESTKLTIRMKTEARLVSACDGATEATLQVPLAREERAMAHWFETVLALSQAAVPGSSDDRTKALSGFHPELRQARGDASIWNTLSSYKLEWGNAALAIPMMPQDEDVKADGERISLRTHGSTLLRGSNYPVRCDVTLQEEKGRFRVTKLTCNQDLDHSSLLEISKEKVRVTKNAKKPR